MIVFYCKKIVGIVIAIKNGGPFTKPYQQKISRTGGNFMMRATLRILFLLAISFTLLIAPLALEFDLSGKAHAMGSSDKKASGKGPSLGRIAKKYRHTDPVKKPLDEEKNHTRSTAPTPVPEPATLLLFGAGAIGLAAVKRKISKK
jgi:hypothetical protein